MELSLKRALVAAGLVTLHWGAYADASYVALPDKPIYVGGGVQPMVMLDITKDHQLHMKAYNDYTDLDADGEIERTYKHSIQYYGYFDSKQCYEYNTSNGVFESVGATSDKYCAGTWSGNFLNWASMTRMDTVRKILYGGTRSTDTATGTILERNYLPNDAHAFAKYYNGNDLSRLTPFSSAPIVARTVTTNNVAMPKVGTAAYQSFNMTFSADLRAEYKIGAQVRLRHTATSLPYFEGTITGISYNNNRTTITMRVYNQGIFNYNSSARTSWVISNISQEDGGISLCNVTQGANSGVNQKSQTNTNPPLLRVAKGNFELWGANSALQCQWTSEASGTAVSFGSVGSNGNIFSVSGMKASAENPEKSSQQFGIGDYNVRVKVCDPKYIVDGTDEKEQGKCKLYGSSWKPVGLLQKYSDTDLIRFGLMTGSYQKNISGGVLRKKIGTMEDEINQNDGTFKTKNFTTTNPPSGSIIKTIDRMRIFGYNYSAGNYLGSGGDNCDYQLLSITEGECRSYGNPMSEIYYESIRYLAGKNQTDAYNYSRDASNVADNILGLAKADWAETSNQVGPLNADNFCAPLNVLVFNSSVSGEDKDLANKSLNEITYPQMDKTIKVATDAVGVVEGLEGKSANFGAKTGITTSANDYALCSAKTISTLGDIFGICPEGPSNNGSYHMAGIASVIKNNRIRNFSTVPTSDVNSLKVNSYAIQLASNTPEIEIPVNGKIVKLSPVYRLDSGATSGLRYGSGSIVDFKIARFENNGSSGALYVNWEDSQQGGDYDQDLWGIISWEVTPAGQLKIQTQTVAASGGSGQGFGYSVSGTNKDGPHFHSGIYSFNYTDPSNLTVYNASNDVIANSNQNSSKVNSSGGCRNCVVTDPATYALYNVVGSTTEDLRDPLYYLAKHGGFKDKNGNGIPDLVPEWDSLINSSGESGSDNIPDNYFYAINPLQLENSLQQAFNSILVTSSSSSVAANSTFLRNNTLVYQAKYFTGDWSGQFLAYNLSSEGLITSIAWEADLLMNNVAPNNRQIVTFNKATGVGTPYRYANVSPAITTALNKNAVGTVDNLGERRLNWVRGASTDENSYFRGRPRTKLGDIIESSPVYVGAPESQVNDPTFKVFQKNQKTREALIYVGANDGMLHAFNAETGVIKFSYMPSVIAEGNLVSKASSINYGDTVSHSYGVNGSPSVADVKFGQNCSLLASTCTDDSDWRTVLVGGLAHGGKGIYALNITDPTRLTEANAANIPLWEFTSANHNGVGYTFSQPQISRICNTRTGVFKPQLCSDSTPVAVFGGGLNPASGKGTLFIVNLQTGALIKAIEVAGGTVSAPNALSSPSIVDVDGDGVMEYVYAGDLNGKMWKFDVQKSTDAAVDFAGSPLYHAKVGNNQQPITSAPELYNHPNGGYLVMFGTGKYIEANDLGTRNTQTFYSIWDKNEAVPTLDGRTNLQEQVNEEEIQNPDDGYNSSNYDYRKSTKNAVDWTDKLGWYMDMGSVTSNDPGERIIYSPQIYNNGIVSFSSLIPAGGVCTFGGYSWNYFLDATSGSALNNSPFGSSEDDLSSRKSTNGIVTPATLIYVGKGIAYAPQSGTSGNLEVSQLNLSGGRTGRVSWREIR